MKTIRKILLSICLIGYIFGLVSNASAQNTVDTVHVIKLHGEVNDAMADYLDRELAVAKENNMNAIIDIDTWGGLIIAADEISNILLNTDVNTTAFVSGKAISAGVIVTISCDNIAMKETSYIGAAETIPDTEKALSAWKGMLSTAATARNRDEELILAMADKRMVIEGLCKEGELLSLSSAQAVKYGLANTMCSDIEEVIDEFDLGTSYEYAEFTASDRVARAITSTTAMNIFFALGFLLLLVEIYTAGFGVAGVLSIICFVMYYFGGIIAGTAEWWSIVLFAIGIGLLIAEMFIPGFGIFGITGFILCLLGLLFSSSSFDQFINRAGIAMLVCAVSVPILILVFGKLKMFQRVTNSEVQSLEDGYSVIKDFDKVKIGEMAVVVNDLRPIGSVEVEGKRYDAYTDDGYIQKGDTVTIVGTKASSLLVRKK